MSRRPAPSPDSPSGLLASVRASDIRIRAAELEKAYAVLAWLDAHPAESIRDAAGYCDDTGGAIFGERALLLGGAGCPLIAEFCIAELAVTLGVADHAARAMASDLLELAHRLPGVWARVEALDLPLWRARRIADKTTRLDRAHVAKADRMLAPIAHRLSVPRVDGSVTRLLAEQDDLQVVPVAEARSRRHVHITLPTGKSRSPYAPSDSALAGLGHITGTLDVLDAADLDKALDIIAGQLATSRPHASADELRAQALGILGRGELLLPLPGDEQAEQGGGSTTHVDPDTGETIALAPVIDKQGRSRASRELVIHVHLSAAALAGSGTPAGDRIASIETGPARLVDVDTVRAWVAEALAETDRSAGVGAGRIDPTRITFRPVIDLNEPLTSSGYTPSARLREQVILRDDTCVFPGCDKPARLADLDHIDPWQSQQPPDPNDPDDPEPDEDQEPQTTTGNLAVLCRYHHRLKTHYRWHYERLAHAGIGAAYQWISPTGQIIRRDP